MLYEKASKGLGGGVEEAYAPLVSALSRVPAHCFQRGPVARCASSEYIIYQETGSPEKI